MNKRTWEKEVRALMKNKNLTINEIKMRELYSEGKNPQQAANILAHLENQNRKKKD